MRMGSIPGRSRGMPSRGISGASIPVKLGRYRDICSNPAPTGLHGPEDDELKSVLYCADYCITITVFSARDNMFQKKIRLKTMG